MLIDWTQGAEKHRRTQGRRRTCRDARPAKNMPGRKAGEDHARSQGPLRGDETTSRSDALHCGASVDARLAKTTPGRNARFAGKLLLVQRCL